MFPTLATPDSPSPFVPSRRKRIKALAPIMLVAAMMLLTGCNSATTGALLGAALGSAAGAGLDHNHRGRGALIGAGIGAAAGYMLGNEDDKARASYGYSGGYQPTYQPAPAYYEPQPAYYYPPAQVRIDYYGGDYCPPPRHHHHHHGRHW